MIAKQALPDITLNKVSLGTIKPYKRKETDLHGHELSFAVYGLKSTQGHFEFSDPQNDYTLRFSEAGLELPPFKQLNSPLLWIEDMDLESKEIQIEKAQIQWSPAYRVAIPTGYGSFQIDKLQFQEYALDQISGVISEMTPLTLDIVSARFLEGKITAHIEFEPEKELLILDGTLHEANIQGLADLGISWIAPAKGFFDGNVHLVVEKGKITQIEGNTHSITLGEINSEVVRILLDKLPSNADKTKIESLLSEKNRVPFDKFIILLKNKDEKSFQAKITFISKKLNLDIEVLVDINFDQEILDNYLNKILKVLRRLENGN